MTVDLEDTARKTYGFSGAMLADVLNESAILAARRGAEMIGPEDVHGGWLKVAVGTSRRRSMDERERSIIAAHEVGHAICGKVHGDKRKVEEISLFAHGEALGVTVSSQEDNDLPSESDLRARLVALMGGRAAEEILFHEVTGGASNDFEAANKIATAMVTRWGMGRDPEATDGGISGRGSLSFLVPTGERSLPSDVQAAATRAIRAILDDAYAEASATLVAHIGTLRRLAAYLVEHERVDGETFDELFDGRRAVAKADEEWRAATSRPRDWGDVVDLAGAAAQRGGASPRPCRSRPWRTRPRSRRTPERRCRRGGRDLPGGGARWPPQARDLVGARPRPSRRSRHIPSGPVLDADARRVRSPTPSIRPSAAAGRRPTARSPPDRRPQGPQDRRRLAPSRERWVRAGELEADRLSSARTTSRLGYPLAIPLISARALTKRYPGRRHRARRSDRRHRAGASSASSASNGAGKSTLIKILLGLLDADERQRRRSSASTSRTQGHRDPPARRLHARARLPAAGHLGDRRSSSHMALISGLPRAAARERTAEVLRHVGLYEERYRAIGGYSTGMKQRVKLAQALVHDPRLLLLDEPTNGLDPAGRDEMLELIRRIGTRVRDRGHRRVAPARRDRAGLRLPGRDRGRQAPARGAARRASPSGPGRSRSRSRTAATRSPRGLRGRGPRRRVDGRAVLDRARRRRGRTTSSATRSASSAWRCPDRAAAAPPRGPVP